MKKLLSVLLAVCIMLTLSVSVFAADITEASDPKTGTAIVTANVPASYTVSIPADTTVEYNAATTAFGKIELKNAKLETNKAVTVSVAAGDLKNAAGDTIAYTIEDANGVFTSEEFTANGEVALSIKVGTEAWANAAVGAYSATVTFTVTYA